MYNLVLCILASLVKLCARSPASALLDITSSLKTLLRLLKKLDLPDPTCPVRRMLKNMTSSFAFGALLATFCLSSSRTLKIDNIE